MANRMSNIKKRGKSKTEAPKDSYVSESRKAGASVNSGQNRNGAHNRIMKSKGPKAYATAKHKSKKY